MVHDLPATSKTSPPASTTRCQPGIDACLTRVNGLVEVQELRGNAMEIHNIILIRQERVRQMKPISLARRHIGFPPQAAIRAFDFPRVHMRPAPEKIRLLTRSKSAVILRKMGPDLRLL
jgi:hypothetical protein